LTECLLLAAPKKTMKGETVLSPSHWFDRPNVFLRFWTINTFFFSLSYFFDLFSVFRCRQSWKKPFREGNTFENNCVRRENKERLPDKRQKERKKERTRTNCLYISFFLNFYHVRRLEGGRDIKWYDDNHYMCKRTEEGWGEIGGIMKSKWMHHGSI